MHGSGSMRFGACCQQCHLPDVCVGGALAIWPRFSLSTPAVRGTPRNAACFLEIMTQNSSSPSFQYSSAFAWTRCTSAARGREGAGGWEGAACQVARRQKY